jgi:hypothetical protein
VFALCFTNQRTNPRPTIPQAANIWRVKNIANMLYFAQMVIFYQLLPEQPWPSASP